MRRTGHSVWTKVENSSALTASMYCLGDCVCRGQSRERGEIGIHLISAKKFALVPTGGIERLRFSFGSWKKRGVIIFSLHDSELFTGCVFYLKD